MSDSHEWAFSSFSRSSQDFKEGNVPRDREHESTRTSDDHKPELLQER